MASKDHAVLIAGGGPTGLMLAAELALAEVDVVVVERRVNQDLDGSRAGGLHSRTIEVLDQRGISERFLAEGRQHPFVGFAHVQLDISDFPTRHNYLLGLWQTHIERILAGWVNELGVPILRGGEVAGLAQDDSCVEVVVSGKRPLRGEYLVGCDGGRSVVRKTAGIDFPGHDPSTSWMIGEVEMAEAPVVGPRPEGGGIGPVDPQAGGGPYRVVLKDRQVQHDNEPNLKDLSQALVVAYGTDFGVHSPNWISRFTDMTRQAASYRQGRVLLAGDAAHVHPPQGGQGLNIGVQDAVNLGWKLAQVVNDISPDSLLDTYHAERHPVGARVLNNTMAQVALSIPDGRHQALRETMTELLSTDESRRRIAGMISGLDVHYDLGEGHPLLGRRMPDLDLVSADGRLRVFSLLHDARPVLLNFGEPGGYQALPSSPRVKRIDAEYLGKWELPVLGEVEAPNAVLVRPDGYVAWVGELTDPRLPEALTYWFG
ncbi:MAG TPA: FAD-dependent monooxygenase [Acidimicrobiia bacterium]|nr:FAD-dependent monooxygenase [Acidimicrobiia bacterium]